MQLINQLLNKSKCKSKCKIKRKIKHNSKRTCNSIIKTKKNKKNKTKKRGGMLSILARQLKKKLSKTRKPSIQITKSEVAPAASASAPEAYPDYFDKAFDAYDSDDSDDSDNKSLKDCSICFYKMRPEQQKTILSCSYLNEFHEFHTECINAYIYKDGNDLCPLCNQEILDGDLELIDAQMKLEKTRDGIRRLNKKHSISDPTSRGKLFERSKRTANDTLLPRIETLQHLLHLRLLDEILTFHIGKGLSTTPTTSTTSTIPTIPTIRQLI